MPVLAKERIILRTRYIPALWPILVYWSWSVKDYLGVSKGMVINIWQDGAYTGVWEKDAIRGVGQRMIQELQDNFLNLSGIRKIGIKKGEKVIETCKSFASNSDQSDFSAYLNFFQQLTEEYQEFIRANMLYWLLTSNELEQEAEKLLREYEDHERQNIIANMVKPTIPSYSQQEEDEFDSIVQLARKVGPEAKEVSTAISQFSKKYFWFPYEYVGPEIWDVESVKKRVQEALRKTGATSVTHNIEHEQKEVVKKYGLSQEMVKHFQIIQAVTLMQDDRKMINAQLCYYLNEVIFGNLAKKLKISLAEARYIDIEIIKELIDGTESHKIQQKLQERCKMLIVTEADEGNEVRFYEGVAAFDFLALEKIQLEVDAKGVNEIRGQIANRGLAVGRVRVLRSSSNVQVFNEGDVLVTGMTTPDYIVWMKKAGAIVTDEGGITSHAAIVSRELNKPCIIGTKIATKVLKDGDEVEVDADRGVIRIL